MTTTRIRIDPPSRADGFDFRGCDNWSGASDLCACETWQREPCRDCDRDIRDGEMIVSKTTTIVDPLDHDEDTDVEYWHVKCPAGED